MATAKHKLAIVIPTIGRYDDLRRMLQSLAAQTRLPDEVVIVDQDETSECFAREFPQLRIHVISLPGSASLKRNAGFRAAAPDADLIGFFDDDIVLEPQTFGALLDFWDAAPEDLGATSCNWGNHPPVYARSLKNLGLATRLGLYGTAKGAVMRSGFQTTMPGVEQDTYVRWLPSGAVVYSRKVLAEFCWDEWFESYSYLEDLDLSYRVSKKYRLAMVAGARFYHYPSSIGRPNLYLFGKKEVLNRLYFVSKHPELSWPLCCLALSIRAAMSLSLGVAHHDFGYFKRIAGNLAGLLMASRSGLRPVAR
jgi:GT2 family glycosyltransferase